MEVLVREASREMGLDIATIREYLTQCLSFELGQAEQEGLAQFFKRALAQGLIDRFHDVEGLSSCGLGTDSVE